MSFRMRRLISVVLCAVAILWCIAETVYADPAEVARLTSEADAALTRFRTACLHAWKYDNLRPTILRAVAPLGTAFQPPDVPVVHLSPASPDYQLVVGEMAYWYSLYMSKSTRLVEERQVALPGDPEIPPQAKAVDGLVAEELRYTADAADDVRASYWQVCAQAWPFINLRPLCGLPGIEADTILNPFLPVPVIKLSEASPDYKQIVASLHDLEPRLGSTASRIADLRSDRQSLAEAAKAAVPAPEAFDDPRIAAMIPLFESLKPAIREWRQLQRDIEALYQPWQLARFALWTLQVEYRRLQSELQLALLEQQDPDTWAEGKGRERLIRAALAALQPQIQKAEYELKQIEAELTKLRTQQLVRESKGGASVDEWIQLSDVFGRCGAAAHHSALPVFEQWVADEPRLWHPYFARAVARLHIGQIESALDDLQRVESKIRLYGGNNSMVAQVLAIRAYALCKQSDSREGERLFAEARKLDPKSWAVNLIRGWSSLERGKHSTARDCFQLAMRLSENSPRWEVYEASALLFAASPLESIRNGNKAIEQATKARDLQADQDKSPPNIWISLNTLSAAFAETGDFETALQWATKAAACAPQAAVTLIDERIALYRERAPYRLE